MKISVFSNAGPVCSDPENHKHVTDFVTLEIICPDCGGIVLAKETSALQEQPLIIDERGSSAIDHVATNNVLQNKVGSQHRYVSPGNPGLAFYLAKPYGLKDFQGHSCHPVLTPMVGYKAGNYSERNGFFNDDDSFSTSYKYDAWVLNAEKYGNLFEKAWNLDEISAQQFRANIVRGYSRIVILFTEIAVRLGINKTPVGLINVKSKLTNREALYALVWQKLAEAIENEFAEGDNIDMEAVDVRDSAIEEPGISPYENGNYSSFDFDLWATKLSQHFNDVGRQYRINLTNLGQLARDVYRTYNKVITMTLIEIVVRIAANKVPIGPVTRNQKVINRDVAMKLLTSLVNSLSVDFTAGQEMDKKYLEQMDIKKPVMHGVNNLR